MPDPNAPAGTAPAVEPTPTPEGRPRTPAANDPTQPVQPVEVPTPGGAAPSAPTAGSTDDLAAALGGPAASGETISPDTVLELDGKLVKLGDLVEHYKKVPDLTADQVKQYELMSKAAGGDRQAILDLMGGNAGTDGATAPAAAAPDDPRVAKLEETVNVLKGDLDRVRPTVEKIDTLRETALLTRLIDAGKDSLPYLSHHPNKGQIALEAYQAVETEVRSMGYDPKVLNEQQSRQLVTTAMQRAEAKLQQQVAIYNGFTAPAAAGANGAAQPVLAVDDQPKPGDRLAPVDGTTVRMVNGQFYDAAGNAVRQGPNGQFVPQTIPAMPGGGAAAPAQAAIEPGKLTLDEFEKDIQRQVEEMSAHAGD